MLATVGGIASLIDEDVVVALHGDVVITNGHADGEFTFRIGHDRSAFCCARRTIDFEGAAIHWNGGAGIAHGAMHGEVADIGEVHTAIYQ